MKNDNVNIQKILNIKKKFLILKDINKLDYINGYMDAILEKKKKSY